MAAIEKRHLEGNSLMLGQFDRPKNIITEQTVTRSTHAAAKAMRTDMSPVERVLWKRLRANQLEGLHFRRQQIVAGYIADFYCHEAGLAIEVDGDTHDDPARDAYRDTVFESKGIRVLRFTNAQVLHETEAVLEAILSATR